MIAEMLITTAALVFATTSLLAVVGAACDRLMPPLWARERHAFALASLAMLPLVIVVAMLPASGSAVTGIPATPAVVAEGTSSADAPFRALVPWVVVGLWAAVAGLLVLRLTVDLVSILKLRARAVDLPVAACLPLSRRLPVRASAEVSAPMLVGYFRPTIVVPVGFAADTRAWPVLEHEIAHARRGDNWAALALRLANAALWWNLPMRMLQNLLERSREELCDDYAAAVTGAPLELSQALLDAALTASKAHDRRLAAGTRGGVLAARVRRLCSARGGEDGCPAVRVAILGPMLGVVVLLATPRLGPAQVAASSADEVRGADTLAIAVARGDTAAVGRLLARGANPDARDTGGDPVLAIAVRDQRLRLARSLLLAGANADAREASGDTVLAAAVRRGDEGAVALLAMAGANPRLADSAGQNALDLAGRAPGVAIDEMLRTADRSRDAARLARWVPPRTPTEPGCIAAEDECYTYVDTDGAVP